MTDFLVVMSYDERGQIFGPCVAGPNAAFGTTFKGTTFHKFFHLLNVLLNCFRTAKLLHHTREMKNAEVRILKAG